MFRINLDNSWHAEQYTIQFWYSILFVLNHLNVQRYYSIEQCSALKLINHMNYSNFLIKIHFPSTYGMTSSDEQIFHSTGIKYVAILNI